MEFEIKMIKSIHKSHCSIISTNEQTEMKVYYEQTEGSGEEGKNEICRLRMHGTTIPNKSLH